jgi:hypothetical protein
MQPNRISRPDEQPVDIIAMIDEALDIGPVPPGTLERCRHCGHDWHGMPCKTLRGAFTEPCECMGSHLEQTPRFHEDGRRLTPPERAYAAIDSVIKLLTEVGYYL